ncbi:hypothetical protein HUT18_20955 [Streptomyces sp. NA04227]|uniref:hypothetical protein n=1 Tax=Streptomyces sp. NA04227 TaxID=2742136 RepID=UPI0015923DA1|nr:hypothetical protein [Streptomyces sp. NA04227]QKW08469.1 hypothetical protein HUT18_20955 [Streptomyces sp. NA04227]
MIRRNLPAAIVLTISAALTLTACGGGDDSKDSDEIVGADKQSPAAGSSPSPSKESGSQNLPDFKLPKDIKVEIEPVETGNELKDQILREQAESLMARQRILVDRDVNSGYLNRYYEGEARDFYITLIKKAKAEGMTITGTYRYYDRKITQNTKDRAVVTYCEDQTKAYSKDVKTGKAQKTEPSPEDFTLNTAVLTKTPNSTWVVQSLTGKTPAQECQ